jgi:hypothetical protein
VSRGSIVCCWSSLSSSSRAPRVEAGYSTSTVIPAGRKRRWKGNPAVSDETAITTRPVVREGAPGQRAKQPSGNRKIWSWAPKGCPTPRRIGQLTVGHINSTPEGLNIGFCVFEQVMCLKWVESNAPKCSFLCSCLEKLSLRIPELPFFFHYKTIFHGAVFNTRPHC